MDRVTSEVVERAKGEGVLYRGGAPVCRVGYNVATRQDVHQTRALRKTEDVRGSFEVEGWLADVDGSGTFWDLVGAEDPLTLHLADGRRWDCVLVEVDGGVVSAGDGLPLLGK